MTIPPILKIASSKRPRWSDVFWKDLDSLEHAARPMVYVLGSGSFELVQFVSRFLCLDALPKGKFRGA